MLIRRDFYSTSMTQFGKIWSRKAYCGNWKLETFTEWLRVGVSTAVCVTRLRKWWRHPNPQTDKRMIVFCIRFVRFAFSNQDKKIIIFWGFAIGKIHFLVTASIITASWVIHYRLKAIIPHSVFNFQCITGKTKVRVEFCGGKLIQHWRKSVHRTTSE